MNLITSPPGTGTIVSGLPMPRFRHIEVVPLTGPTSAAIAYK